MFQEHTSFTPHFHVLPGVDLFEVFQEQGSLSRLVLTCYCTGRRLIGVCFTAGSRAWRAGLLAAAAGRLTRRSGREGGHTITVSETPTRTGTEGMCVLILNWSGTT